MLIKKIKIKKPACNTEYYYTSLYFCPTIITVASMIVRSVSIYTVYTYLWIVVWFCPFNSIKFNIWLELWNLCTLYLFSCSQMMLIIFFKHLSVLFNKNKGLRYILFTLCINKWRIIFSYSLNTLKMNLISLASANLKVYKWLLLRIVI